MNNRKWSKDFIGTPAEYIKQAKYKGISDRSINYWLKFNWNLKV